MKLIYILVIFFYSCTTFSTFQTPQVVEEDEVGFGFSLSNSWVAGNNETEFIPISIPSLQIRYGIGDNSDVGFLFVGLPVLGSSYIDYKYQFLNDGMLGAFTIGTGFWLWPGDFFDVRNPSLISPFLGISFGNKRLYVGSRVYYYYYSHTSIRYTDTGTDSVRVSSSYILITPIIGLTLGKGNFKFAPEINFGIPVNINSNSSENFFLNPLYTYSIGFIYLPTGKQ